MSLPAAVVSFHLGPCAMPNKLRHPSPSSASLNPRHRLRATTTQYPRKCSHPTGLNLQSFPHSRSRPRFFPCWHIYGAPNVRTKLPGLALTRSKPFPQVHILFCPANERTVINKCDTSALYRHCIPGKEAHTVTTVPRPILCLVGQLSGSSVSVTFKTTQLGHFEI